MKIAERYAHVLEWLAKAYPNAETELHYRNPFELLVAVVLSAQCTDKRVNLVTPALFEAYPDADHLSLAEPEEVFRFIRSVSYPNNKAKHLVGLARKLMEEFGGDVPSDRAALETLPGVGRKTANVVASVVFGQAAMAVDTHVFRVSARIGLTRGARTPRAAEEQLMRHIPEKDVHLAHHWLILHGRYRCTARSPQCADCGLIDWCKEGQKRLKKQMSQLST
jgi:endonuclease-3